MANTCCNSIRIDGPAADLKKIHAAALAAQNEINVEKSDLYRMLERLGATEERLEGIRCREDYTGGPVEYDEETETVIIESESANSFQHDAWQLVKKMFPKVSIYYRADEPGNMLFVTNDVYGVHFHTRLRVDWSTADGGGEIAYLDDPDEFVPYVKKNINPTVETEEQARLALAALEDEDGCGIVTEIDFDESNALL